MGRNVHCSEDKRNLIKIIQNQGKTLKEISNLMDCSINMVCNSIFKKTPETRGRKRKTSGRDDKNILYYKRNPFAKSIEIKTTLGLQIDASTVRKRLTQQYVKAKVPKKCTFLSPNNIKNRKDFARKQVGWPSSKWRNIL